MGQEILYCYKCQTRLLGSEFDKGKAFKVGGKASCAKCVQDLLAELPEARAEYDKARQAASSSRVPAAASESGSGKYKPATVRNMPPVPPPPPPKPKNPMILVAIIGGAILAIVLAMMMSSSRSTPGRTEPGPTSGPTPPAPPPPGPRPEDPKPPVVPPGSAFGAELREIDDKMRTGLSNEEFKAVADLLAEARKKRATPEWLSEIDLRVPQVEARVRRASLPLREKGIEAAKRKDDAEVKRLHDRILAWGFPSVADDFDKALAEAAAAPPPPPPPAPPEAESSSLSAKPPAASSLTPSTVKPLIVYDDGLGKDILDHSWSAKVVRQCPDKFFEGGKSYSYAPERPWAGVYLHILKGADVTEYPFVTFAICSTIDRPHIVVYLWGADKKGSTGFELDKLGPPLKAGEWQKYVVPTAPFTPSGGRATGFILHSGAKITTTGPLLYLDSVSFLRGAEATPPPRELEAYQARWTSAAAKAALRDYAGAQKELEDAGAGLKDDAAKSEAAADLDLVKLAAPVAAEAAKAVEKWTKGQKVHVEFLNGAGERESADGTVLSADAVRLTLLRDGAATDLPVAEILPSSLAEIFRARADRKPTDARAAAAFCLFEGDPEAAKKHWGDGPAIPAKLLALAKPRPESEAAARRTFWAAEGEFAAPRTRAAAVEKYTALLSGELSRLKPYLAARLEAARDTVFLAEDLAGAGTFQLAGGAKMDVYWSSNADTAPSAAKANYVEAEFAALPGAAYKAWIWAGACCLETFEFSVQAAELTAPNPKSGNAPIPCDPGSDNAITPKAPSLTLRKWHAQHGGPKEPQKWDWFPVALPKYEAGGPKKLRVLSAQQGFTVGAIVISSSRRDTPRDTEIKELEKIRTGGRKGPAPGIPGQLLYEVWGGIDGNAVEDLTRHPSFAGKPSSSGFRDIFEEPRDVGDRFGARMRGFVHPPISGAYTFWIASDDSSELFLSTDDSPLKKRSIAKCTEVAGIRDWTRLPSCKSAPIVLTAGKRYYVESLHKEGGGGDHCAVGWTLPDGAEERPIPGNRLSAWNTAAPPPPAPANLTFFRGYNLNGQPVVIDGRKWEGKGSQTLGTSDGFENNNVPLIPPTDEARTAMIRSSVFARGGSVAKVYQVPPGTYHVYLYVWEDNNPETFDIFLQNKEVMKGYNSGAAGHWDKLGPWTAAVTEGVLEIRTSGGDANLSGLEIWKVGK